MALITHTQIKSTLFNSAWGKSNRPVKNEATLSFHKLDLKLFLEEIELTSRLHSNRNVTQSFELNWLQPWTHFEKLVKKIMLSLCMYMFIGFIGIRSSWARWNIKLIYAQSSCPPVSCPEVPGTLCFKLNRQPLYSLYPSMILLLHSLTQLKIHSNTQILQAFWKTISMHSSVHFFIFLSFWLASENKPCFSIAVHLLLVLHTLSGEAVVLMSSIVYIIDQLVTFSDHFYCEASLALVHVVAERFFLLYCLITHMHTFTHKLFVVYEMLCIILICNVFVGWTWHSNLGTCS